MDHWNEPEETLDPQDWDAMKALGHQMVDDMFDYLRTVRERPAWQPVPDKVKNHLNAAAPRLGQDPTAIYEEFTENILPYPMGNIHPRFWGWVMGTGTPLGMLAEMLAAGMNPNMAGGDHAGNLVEEEVLNWIKEMLGFPKEASGLLVSGGSMANLVGLTVARAHQAGYDIRAEGLQTGRPQMVLYGSVEMHSSLQKAVELLGLGSRSLRKIAVNADYQIDLPALREAIRQDRAAGLQPFCVVGNAGTVNTGALDDLQALGEICRAEGLWFHVDGAIGAAARMSPDLQKLVAGIDQADSLGIDLHKWLYMPFEAGCVLVRSASAHRGAFSLTPEYLAHSLRGLSGGSQWFSDYGVQLSRGFRALKVWMSLKEHGLDKYGRMVRQNVRQAAYLVELVKSAPELELLAPAPLNIVCFRFRAEGYDEAGLNRLNQEILFRLQESGIAAPSSTILTGKFALRTAITNHRSRREDFVMMTSAVIRLGRELAQAGFGREG